MLRKAISHQQYEKISDDLILLGYNTILKFTVSLANYSDRFGRMSYHKELEYNSPKSKNDVINIKRSFDFYLSLENIKDPEVGNKEFIRIGVSEIYALRMIIDKAVEWYISNKYSNLFARKNNRLILTKRIEPLVLNNLPMGKYLKLEPVVGTYLNSDEDYPALRMFLSSDNNYCDININKLMGLKYIVDSINMYESAQLLLNYIQRPEFGTNLYSMNNVTDIEYDVTATEGRKVTKNQSYFDKMKNLE